MSMLMWISSSSLKQKQRDFAARDQRHRPIQTSAVAAHAQKMIWSLQHHLERLVRYGMLEEGHVKDDEPIQPL